ncbi:hypothetical protein BCEP4_910013 [Burkholderia cepacia]|nr:hypothetical protein BCEP4_910013 [Burkholderia cepacia]
MRRRVAVPARFPHPTDGYESYTLVSAKVRHPNRFDVRRAAGPSSRAGYRGRGALASDGRAGTMQRFARRRLEGRRTTTRHEQETRPRWPQRTAFRRHPPNPLPSTPAPSRPASTACRRRVPSGSSSSC